MESFSDFDPVVKGSVADGREYLAVYMNKKHLSIATGLKDQMAHPVLGDEFIPDARPFHDKDFLRSVLCGRARRLQGHMAGLQMVRLEIRGPRSGVWCNPLRPLQ